MESNIRIGIIGPESTGKTTLTNQLAAIYSGTAVPEYARTYVEQLQTPYTYEDVCNIAKKQIEEISSTYDTQYVFFDTELIITYVWFIYKYGNCPDWFKKGLLTYRMDAYLLCYPDIAFVPDPVRENPHIREELFLSYLDEVEKLGTPYYIIKKSDRDCIKDLLQQMSPSTLVLTEENSKGVCHFLNRLHLNG